MTKQQAEAAVNLLRPKYPDAAVESEAELEDDSEAPEPATNDYSVGFNEVVADTIAEIIDQLKEDFGDDSEVRDIIVHLEALAQTDPAAAGGEISELHDDDPDMTVDTKSR